MNRFTVEHTPAEIVKVFPKASDLFKKQHIQFCCGGDRPLHTVFIEQGLDEAAVLTELNTAYETWNKEDPEIVDWDQIPLSELIDHIVDTHHSFLKDELSPLGEFVTRVFHRHGATQPHLQELYRLYLGLKAGIEAHMSKEENEIFPLMKEYEKNPSHELASQIHEANKGLEHEHEAQTDILRKMGEITNDYTPPAEACNTYRITYARLAELEANTFQHIHLENNILFKRIK